jgi:hypothetical protein
MEKDMGGGNAREISPKQISLGDGFGEVALTVNGVRVEVHADESIDAFTAGAVKVHPAANDDGKPGSATSSSPKPGDKQPDGTVYAGLSPDTGKAMYATPADVPLTMKWKQAMEYAAKLDAHGHKDWRAPTKGELNVLYNNRAAIGGFDESGSYPGGWYWSSSQDGDYWTWGQRCSDGYQGDYFKLLVSSLRCVRG